MQKFPWWTTAQRQLADEVKPFVDALIPLAEELAYKKQFPRAALQEVARQGYFGAMIPKQYGGRFEDWGVTGACIISEQLGRAGTLYAAFTSTMVGSVHQILHFGSEAQKQRFLPPIAKGECFGAITITEPFVGSDASGIKTKGRREGDHYVLNGKKRFIGHAGIADTYLTYVRTSDRPEDKAQYRHLTAFVVEKGTPGFTIERVADIVALDGNHIGYINFQNTLVPVGNRIGEEGDGWKVMTSGLNAERLIAGAQWLGLMQESVRYAVYHMQRRLQFGQPTIDMPTNQAKVSEMISKRLLGRLMTFYTAYLLDQGLETPLESALVKLFNADSALEIAIEAIQCMGGDGLSNSYPPARAMRDAKLAQIVAGTQEVNKQIIFRQAMKLFGEDFVIPPFKFNTTLNCSMPTNGLPAKQQGSDGILRVLAEYYRNHPGLHVSRRELLDLLGMTEQAVDAALLNLEEQDLVDLYRDKKGNIALVKSTYEGLDKIHPPDYYRSFPAWVDPQDLF